MLKPTLLPKWLSGCTASDPLVSSPSPVANRFAVKDGSTIAVTIFRSLALPSLICLLVMACSAPTASPSPLGIQPIASVQPTARSAIYTTAPEVQGRLDSLWRQFEPNKDISWQAAYTPLFASEWPPTPQTIWTRYAFAYGHDLSQPALVDAQRVARPWARVEFHASAVPTI